MGYHAIADAECTFRDFFVALLAYLQAQIAIDPARIYATGMSNGGTMAHRLGCDMAGTFAAIAPVSGGHTAYDQCQIEAPISVLVLHGTEDPIIPFAGSGTDSAPVGVWLAAWAARNGCDPEPVISLPHQNIRVETWENCDAGVEVVLYALKGAGHVWPGGNASMMPGGDFPFLDATDLIWDFFASHAKGTVDGP